MNINEINENKIKNENKSEEEVNINNIFRDILDFNRILYYYNDYTYFLKTTKFDDDKIKCTAPQNRVCL